MIETSGKKKLKVLFSAEVYANRNYRSSFSPPPNDKRPALSSLKYLEGDVEEV